MEKVILDKNNFRKSVHFPCPYGNEDCPKCNQNKWVATELGNGANLWCVLFHSKHLEESKKLQKIRCNKCGVVKYNIDED